jgi:peptidoglycan/xylan/chitin deacetylase (PgdA/CDA1 family)
VRLSSKSFIHSMTVRATLPFVFISCSTPQPTGPQADTQGRPPARSIASLADADRALKEISDSHLLAARYLRDFDAILANPQTRDSALESDIYARLVATRMIRERNLDQIEELNRTPIQNLSAAQVNERLQSRAKLQGVRGVLGQLTARSIGEVSGTQIQPREWSGLQSQLSAYTLRKDISSLLEKASLVSEVEDLAREWKRDVLSHREPQSNDSPAKIQPSAGRNGNLIGTEYPSNTWSLTYDDGPGTTSTEVMLQTLQDFDVKATFFQVTNRLLTNPTQAQAVREAGMELANHSWTHANLPRVSSSQLDREIRDSSAEIETIHGARPKYFRLPYGSGVNSQTIRTRIAEEGQVHVFWNVDSLDWQDKNPASVARRVISQVESQRKGIILFHDIHAHTPTASRTVIEHLKEKGARIITVSQAVDEINTRRR